MELAGTGFSAFLIFLQQITFSASSGNEESTPCLFKTLQYFHPVSLFFTIYTTLPPIYACPHIDSRLQQVQRVLIC